jgi:cell division protein ZapA
MMAKAAPPGEATVTLDVSLLGRDYKFACKVGEEAELRDAVEFLDRRMRDIRETSKTHSAERIAVMAALNLAHEFQRNRALPTTEPAAKSSPALIDAPGARRRIASMRSAIDQVLAGGQEKLL